MGRQLRSGAQHGGQVCSARRGKQACPWPLPPMLTDEGTGAPFVSLRACSTEGRSPRFVSGLGRRCIASWAHKGRGRCSWCGRSTSRSIPTVSNTRSSAFATGRGGRTLDLPMRQGNIRAGRADVSWIIAAQTMPVTGPQGRGQVRKGADLRGGAGARATTPMSRLAGTQGLPEWVMAHVHCAEFLWWFPGDPGPATNLKSGRRVGASL